MTAEFAFLAAGLLLGAAGGGALAAVKVRRPAGSPEVRITITPDAIPRRRAATLATDPFLATSPLPAPGGPADPWIVGSGPVPQPANRPGLPPAGAEMAARTARTLVPNGPPARIAIPIVSEPDPVLVALLPVPTGGAIVGSGMEDGVRSSRVPALVRSATAAAAVHEEVLVAAGGTSAGWFGAGGPAGHEINARLPGRAADALGRGILRARRGDGAGDSEAAGHASSRRGNGARDGGDLGSQPSPPSALCADEDEEVDRRCRMADEARQDLDALTAELLAARTNRDRHMTVINASELAAEGLAFRERRDRARAAFQSARELAATAREIAAAAGVWLAELDRINAEAATASGQLERDRANLEVGTATVEHLAAQVESARRDTDAANAACTEARRRATDCAEAAAAPEARPAVGTSTLDPAAGPSGGDAMAGSPGDPVDPEPRDEPLTGPSGGADESLGPIPRSLRPEQLFVPMGDDARPRRAIERMLAGEHDILRDVAARLAGNQSGPEIWENRLTALLEAILFKAVDASAILVPAEHPFWAMFSPEESRDIVSALAALGHHFDGLGGWLDDRSPGQRDLSLAVAHAGLDPMRIRQWPGNAESADLMRDAVILGSEYLFAVAPDLSVVELQAVLGREADALADLWADWDLVQPELLATG